MRSAPSVSIFCALALSRHLVRRPTFSGSSQPEAAVRMRAWRVVFSSMPRRANEASTAEVHAVPSPGSTNSPSNVNSRPRALGAPAACRRESVGVGSTANDLLAGMTRAAYQPGCRSPCRSWPPRGLPRPLFATAGLVAVVRLAPRCHRAVGRVVATEFLVAIEWVALSVIVAVPVVLRQRGGAGHVVGVGPGDVPRRDLGVSVITGPQTGAGRPGCFVRGHRDEEHPRAGDQKHHDEDAVDPERRGQAGAD